MKEIILSLFETSRDRVKTPLFGSFAISFVIYNFPELYQFFMSDESVKVRVADLRNIITGNRIGIPIIIALFYLLILPAFDLAIDHLSAWSNKEKRQRKHERSVERLEIEKKEAELRYQIKSILAGSVKIDDLQRKIEEMEEEKMESDVLLGEERDRISQLQSQIDTQQKDIERRDNEFKEEQRAANQLRNHFSSMATNAKNAHSQLRKPAQTDHSGYNRSIDNIVRSFEDKMSKVEINTFQKYFRYKVYRQDPIELTDREQMLFGSIGLLNNDGIISPNGLLYGFELDK